MLFFFFIIRMLILVGLIRVLYHTERPFLCAGIYGVVTIVLCLLLGAGLVGSLISGLISLGL